MQTGYWRLTSTVAGLDAAGAGELAAAQSDARTRGQTEEPAQAPAPATLPPSPCFSERQQIEPRHATLLLSSLPTITTTTTITASSSIFSGPQCALRNPFSPTLLLSFRSLFPFCDTRKSVLFGALAASQSCRVRVLPSCHAHLSGCWLSS